MKRKKSKPTKDNKGSRVLLEKALQRHKAGYVTEAQVLYQRVLRDFPRNAKALHYLGVIEYQKKDYASAIKLMQESLKLGGNLPEWYSNLGLAFFERNQFDEAIRLYQKSLKLKPDVSEVHVNLGNALLRSHNQDGAESHYRQAIALNSKNPHAYNGLGVISSDKQAFSEAIESFRHALAVEPTNADALNNLGCALKAQGHIDEALDCYRKALSIKADSYSWFSNYLFSLHYKPELTPEEVFKEHRTFGKLFDAKRQSFINHTPLPDKILRVGYVSPDFRHHPVGYFLEGLLTQHSANEVEVYCYSDVINPDELTDHLKSLSPHWRHTFALDTQQLCELILDDGIDILVDLAGHTAGNRLAVFGLRAAPVQVTWLGYFDTTGLDTMDYIIADPIVISEHDHEYFIEKVVHLPGCYLNYRPASNFPDITPLPAKKNGYITLGCFNNLMKVNPELVATWAIILKQLPNSRLVLKNKLLANPDIRDSIRDQFIKHGIPSDRIYLYGPSAHLELLQTYADIDIALDPFPYSGGTTTCEALAMGVPVITLMGKLFVSRVSASILSCIGLDSCVTESPEHYIRTVVNLANSPSTLSSLREQMRDRMFSTSLGNAKLFTDNLQNTYRRIWWHWCAENDTQAVVEVAIKKHEKGELDKALELYQLILEKHPNHPEVLHFIGIISYQVGDYETAIDVISRAISIKPDFPDALYNLGLVLQAKGDLTKAGEAFGLTLELQPGHPDALNNLGVISEKLGRFEKAKHFYQEALHIQPDYLEARNNLRALKQQFPTVMTS